MSKVRAYTTIVLALLILSGIAYGISRFMAAPVLQSDSPFDTSRPANAPSPEVLAYLAQSKGFQHVVSYTRRGFEPSRLTVKKGEAVRFINNSKEGLWISATADAGAVYPLSGSVCGQTFDTCGVLRPGEFWELTFTESGEWSYRNNANIENVAVVDVQ
jgi:plastocyanin